MAHQADRRSRVEPRDAARAATGVPLLRDARARGRFPAASEVGGCLETTPLRSPRARENDLRVHALAQGSDHAAGGALRPPSVLLFLLALSALVFAQAEPTTPIGRLDARSRVKDIARVQGADANYVEGIGLVVGLPGTGDSPKELSQRLEAAWLKYRDRIEITPKDLQNKNVAIVSVSAELPAFQQPGTYVDVHVASLADAKSLRGGRLVITKLYGPKPIEKDDTFYVTASGPLQIGGGAAGNPTTATIPNGGRVERAAPSTVFSPSGTTQSFVLVLNRPDWNVATAIGEQLNRMALGLGESVGRPTEPIAAVMDAGRVRVEVPARSYRNRAEEFVALVLSQEVLLGTPHEPEAQVVISERTGTYAVTGYVTVNPGTVQKGNVVVTIPFTRFRRPLQPNARPERETGSAGGTVYLVDVLDNLADVGFSSADIVDLIKQMDQAGMINGVVRSE